MCVVPSEQKTCCQNHEYQRVKGGGNTILSSCQDFTFIMQLPLKSQHLGNYHTFAAYHKHKIAEKDDKLINQHPKILNLPCNCVYIHVY